MKPAERTRTEKGVTYCGTELDALALKASMLPSRLGNKSLLDEVMKSLSGNVIGPRPQTRADAPSHLPGKRDEQANT